MIKILIIIFLTMVFSKVTEYVFASFNLTKINYKGYSVPYSGGTAIFLGVASALYIYSLTGVISNFKMLFFLIIIFVVYLIGLIDDLIGDRSIKGLGGNIKSAFNRKLSTGILKAVGVVIISCYINFFFNEEFWILKGIITAMTTNMFNLLDLRPGRCSKVYFIFYALIPLRLVRWTSEVYFISVLVLLGYYCFDAYGYSMLGDSGSNLLGFIFGLVVSESIGTNFSALIIIFLVIFIIQLLLDRYSLTRIIESIPFLNYIDKLLTEREFERNVKS